MQSEHSWPASALFPYLALTVAREYEPAPIHLLVTDLMMPRLGGSATTEQLQARHPGMRVLVKAIHHDSG